MLILRTKSKCTYNMCYLLVGDDFGTFMTSSATTLNLDLMVERCMTPKSIGLSNMFDLGRYGGAIEAASYVTRYVDVDEVFHHLQQADILKGYS